METKNSKDIEYEKTKALGWTIKIKLH